MSEREGRMSVLYKTRITRPAELSRDEFRQALFDLRDLGKIYLFEVSIDNASALVSRIPTDSVLELCS